MPTPEAFQGLRKAFLEGEREGYKNAVANNTHKDFVMDVVRRYLKRFPLNLADDEEPSPQKLAAVDDAEPDEERLYPDPTDYPEDQGTYNKLVAEYDAETKLIGRRTRVSASFFISSGTSKTSTSSDTGVSLCRF